MDSTVAGARLFKSRVLLGKDLADCLCSLGEGQKTLAISAGLGLIV